MSEAIHSRELAHAQAPAVCSPITSKSRSLPLPARIAFVGNYLPRQCGITAFTADLCTAFANEFGRARLFAIPVNDPESSHEYPEQVPLKLAQKDLVSYKRAAEFLNFIGNDLVCVRYEYGAFAGRYILTLLRKLKIPLVTTLNTALRAPDAIAEAVLHLLDNDGARHAMRKRAYIHSRKTTWPRTERKYMASFQRTLQPQAAQKVGAAAGAPDDLPALNTSHMLSMTDDTGILQHAIFSVPNSCEGYTTDDNARALIVSTLLDEDHSHAGKQVYSSLSRRYLAFLWLAFNTDTGMFRNFLGYDRRWLEDVGSEDSHGRALWSLGKVLGHSRNAGLRGAAGRLFEAAVPATLTFTSPRAWAFSVLGMQAYLDWFPRDTSIQGVGNVLANRLLDIYEHSHSDTWRWFEKSLSYSNARLSQALILAGWRSGNQRMIEAGMDSLRWLVAEQHRDDKQIFVPIGSNGFFIEGDEKARFDQQPVEACATVSACLEVYRLTEESYWLEEAECAFRWFLGKNDLCVPLYDATTGGCRDGLHPDRINENQGAESTLSFLMALLEMQKTKTANAQEQRLEMSTSS